MHPFYEYILRYSDLSMEEWKEVEKCLVRRRYNADDHILKDGQICRKLYFLEAGFLRYFTYRDGEEVTKYFTEAPYCFTSQRSFTQDTPKLDNIQALEASIVWEMEKSAAFRLLEIPSWSEFIRKLIQEVQFYTEEILQALQSETAEQRYAQMIAENDIIIQKAPLKMVASYLGIAPQSLSRIRKKYYQQQRKLT